MNISNDIKYVGVDDHQIDLFEGQYIVPNGMAYNSYVISDSKVAVMDTVDKRFTHEWLDHLAEALGGREPDYLVVQHMEPDHSANIVNFMMNYPKTQIVSSSKAFGMMSNFFGTAFEDRRIVVGDGDELPLGKHVLHFVSAPMVHWPEVIMSYDSCDKVLFSADAFGKFGALDVEEEWSCEARRYYFGIVGKFGPQVQSVLKKVADLDIKTICPLHGPILNEDISQYLKLYDTWSSYGIESDGVAIFYTSVYGNTKKAVDLLVEKLQTNGCPEVVIHDLAREDLAECVEDAFRYGRIVLATTTYNGDIFPFMKDFISRLTERSFQNRMVALMENGSWAPQANRIRKKLLENSRAITYAKNQVTIMSALNNESKSQIEAMALELCKDDPSKEEAASNSMDMSALFNIGYGLYVVTSNDGRKDNGIIVNTITQVTNTPNRVAVTINKESYSYHVIQKTGFMNINCLSVETPYEVFQNFGFRSGRNVDKFARYDHLFRSNNGLVILPEYINSFMSLKVEDCVDLGTHGMFICSVTEARVFSDKETMTYTYYQKNVKPKPQTEGRKGYVCKICGYVYEGDELPDDFICPTCKHGASDFEPIV